MIQGSRFRCPLCPLWPLSLDVLAVLAVLAVLIVLASDAVAGMPDTAAMTMSTPAARRAASVIFAIGRSWGSVCGVSVLSLARIRDKLLLSC